MVVTIDLGALDFTLLKVALYSLHLDIFRTYFNDDEAP